MKVRGGRRTALSQLEAGHVTWDTEAREKPRTQEGPTGGDSVLMLSTDAKQGWDFSKQAFRRRGPRPLCKKGKTKALPCTGWGGRSW